MAAQQRLNIIFGANVDQFKRAIAGIQKDLGRFSRQAESAGRTLTQSLTVPLGLAGAAAIRSFGQFERLENALAAVMGSSEGARAEIEKLRKTAEAPGLGFEQAVQASARLQAVGLSADEARETITQFGNAVARSGGGAEALDGAVLALTQIQSKGKISAEEINQLNERIFEIRPALEAAFGTSNSEELQKLGVSSEEFISKVTAEFAKLERVNGGVANSFENFFDSAKTSLSVLGAEINTVFNISGALDKLSGVVNEAVTRFKALDDGTKRFILSALAVSAAIGPVLIVIAKLASLQSVLLSGVKLLSTGFAAFASPVGIAVVAIATLAAGLVYAYKKSETFRNFVDKLGRAIKVVFRAAADVFGRFADLAVSGFNLVKATAIAFVDVTKARFASLGKFIAPVVDGIVKIRETLIEVGGLAVRVALGGLVGFFNGVIGLITEAFKIAKENIQAFGTASELVFHGKFKQALDALPTDFKAQGKRITTAFSEGFRDGAKGVYSFIYDLQQAFKDNKQVIPPVTIDTALTTDGVTDPTKPTGEGQGRGKINIAPIGTADFFKSYATLNIRIFEEGRKFKESLANSLNIKGIVEPTRAALASVGEDARKALDEYDLSINTSKNRFKAFGDEAQFLKEKLDATRTALAALAAMGYDSTVPAFAAMVTEADKMQASLDAINTTQSAMMELAAGFRDAFIGTFEALGEQLANGEASVVKFAFTFVNSMLDAVNAALKVVAVEAFKSAIISGGGFGAFLAPALAIGAIAAIKGILGKASVPKLAQGGVAFGPSLAVVGDNPGARVDPEVISPLSKLKKLIGGDSDGAYIAEARISGSDLLILMKKAELAYNRVR